MNLDGIKVWVTRPGDQADQLCQLIKATGGEAIHFPTLEITITDNTSKAREKLRHAAEFTHVIFVSSNAVKFAQRLVPDLSSFLQEALVFAVGKGTREALEEMGIRHATYNSALGGSEGLLKLHALNDPAVSAARVLIVRGSDGRELLAEELQRRGADVHYVEVYQRKKPPMDPARIAELWHDHKPDVVVVTSVEGLHNLIDLMGVEYREELLNTDLVVISDRVKNTALSLGFVSAPVVATDTSDKGLLNAVLKKAE